MAYGSHTHTLGGFGDQQEATQAMAGIRVLAEGTAAPLTSAAASYTMTHPDARRLLVMHLGATVPTAGDIRFRVGATASASYMPLIPQKYATFELTGPFVANGVTATAEFISFYNTSADTVTIYVCEIMQVNITAVRRVGRVSPPLNANPANCIVSTSSVTVPNDGTTTVTLTFFVLDNNSSPVVGATIVPSGTGSVNTFGSVAVTSASGYTTCTFKTTGATAHVISCTANGIPVTGTVTVTGVASQTADATTTTIATNVSTLTNGSTFAITVQAKQASTANKAIGGDTVTLGSSGGTATFTIGSVVDNGDGTYSATGTATGVGTAKTVTGTINGVTISGGTLPTVAVTSAGSYTAGDILDNGGFESNFSGFTDGSYSGTPTIVTRSTTEAKAGTYSCALSITANAATKTALMHWPFYFNNGLNGYVTTTPVPTLYGRFWIKTDSAWDATGILKLALIQDNTFNKIGEFAFFQGKVVFGYPWEWASSNPAGVTLMTLAALHDGNWHSIEFAFEHNNTDLTSDYPACRIWVDDVDLSIAAPHTNAGSWTNGRINAGSRDTTNNPASRKCGVFSGFNVVNGTGDGHPFAESGNVYMDRVSLSSLGRVGP